MIYFEYPYLALLLILPFLIRSFSKVKGGLASAPLRVPFIKDFERIQRAFPLSARSLTHTGKGSVFWFLMLVWALLVLALMRPIKTGDPVRLNHEGRDILLICDISTSMLEDDFVFRMRHIPRIDAVRAVVADFVTKRPNDRLGLILFGTRAYLQVPLTFDRQAVLDVLGTMQAGMAGQSTAIGDAVALGLKTLKNNKNTKDNQIIILLTDGENNDGKMGLPQAIALAKKEGIKAYTVGIGSPLASASAMFFGLKRSDLDEKSLKALADATNGTYFKVTGLADLVDVYQKINTLETDTFEDNYFYPKVPLYFVPLLAAFVLSLLGLITSVLKGRLHA